MPDIKPGRWKTRNGGEAIVEENIGKNLTDKTRPWCGWLVRHWVGAAFCPVLNFWAESGRWSLQSESCFDLVEYVGTVDDRARHGIPASNRHRCLVKQGGRWRE